MKKPKLPAKALLLLKEKGMSRKLTGASGFRKLILI